MKRFQTAALFAGLSLSLLVGLAVTHADGPETKSSFTALQKKGKKKRKKARGRLPFYYRQAGVSKEQTEKIYGIQSSYRDKISALEEQLKALKAKRDSEVEAVLSSDQKKKVEELREAARKKREARKKKRSKKSKKAKKAKE